MRSSKRFVPLRNGSRGLLIDGRAGVGAVVLVGLSGQVGHEGVGGSFGSSELLLELGLALTEPDVLVVLILLLSAKLLVL